jgi:hypothetical protein
MTPRADLPVANQPNVATSQINLIIPIRSMQKRALVLLNPLDRRPLPVVQDTRRIDENVAMIIHNLPALEVLDLHIVPALLLVPRRAIDLVPCLDVLVQPILARKVVEVRVDFPRAGVDGGPVELGLKGPCVVVGGHVACASGWEFVSSRLISGSDRRHDPDVNLNLPRIPILKPRPRHLRVLLVYLQTVVLEVLLQLIRHQQPRCTGSNANDADMALCVDGALEPMLSICLGAG